jgi:hypothetical protein
MMDWDKVVEHLTESSNFCIVKAELASEKGGDSVPFSAAALTLSGVRDALKYGLESAQEGQSPDAGQPDHET